MARSRESKKRLEKRLAESKNLYYRRTLDGGCVLLQSDYWLARAVRPQALPVSETAVPSDPTERWLAELTYICRQARFKPGWIWHKFHAKFGVYPPHGMKVDPIPPSDEVKDFVKAQQAAYRAAKKTEAQHSDDRTADASAAPGCLNHTLPKTLIDREPMDATA